MTTLPTTTPMRLPRPAGATPLAMPGTLQAQQQSTSQMTGADIWRVIRSNMWLIIIMLVLSTILGFGLNWYLSKYYSSFTAAGYVQINPPQRINLAGEERVLTDIGGINLDQRTQAALLTQDALFMQVLQNPNSE